MKPALLFSVVLALSSACALLSRGASAEWRWYTPETVRPQLTSGVVRSGPVVRIRRVTAGANLGTRIAFGNGAYEGGYYEERRWTEGPEVYVRHALERTLCQNQRFRCLPDGNAPALDVEVLKFQELKTAKSHAGLVSLRVVLSTDQILLDDTIQFVAQVAGPRFDDVVAAIANALDSASEEVARRVRSALAR